MTLSSLFGEMLTSRSGIYVPDDERWPEHFRGIGIRIEDSVSVQKSSPLVLTTEAVKEVRQSSTFFQIPANLNPQVVDIEALRA